jgi:imidazolonepropionase-like amidohydrolase
MNRLTLVNATVLDVVTGDLVPDQAVVMEGGVIVEVDAGVTPAADAEVIDCGGRVVMPGLCDAHVHVVASTANLGALGRWPESYVTALAAQNGRDMLMRGFTTVRDAGGADFGLVRAFHEGVFEGPRILFAGKALSQTGGHGDMREAGEREPACCCCAGLGRVCDGVSEVRRACRDEIRKGCNQIKLMVSGGVASPTDRMDSTQFSEEEIIAAVQETEAANIYCMGHAYTSRAIARASRCGVRSIEHGNYLDAPTAAVMAENGTFLVPTQATYSVLGTEGPAAGLPPAMAAKLGDVFEAGLRAIETAAAAGVKIVFGTDLLGSMQTHQLDEFSIRAEVQAPIDIIRSATVVAAELFRLEGRVGVVAPGAWADLLVLDSDPLQDLSVLQRPETGLRAIIQGGRVVRADL